MQFRNNFPNQCDNKCDKPIHTHPTPPHPHLSWIDKHPPPPPPPPPPTSYIYKQEIKITLNQLNLNTNSPHTGVSFLTVPAVSLFLSTVTMVLSYRPRFKSSSTFINSVTRAVNLQHKNIYLDCL